MNWIKQVMKGPLKPSIETLTLVIAHKKAAAAPSALLVHLSVRCVCMYVDVGADHLMPLLPLLGFVARVGCYYCLFSTMRGEKEYNQAEHTA